MVYLSFQVENSYDYLRMYDGNSSDANLLAELTGYEIPANVSSCGNQIHVVFTSDGSVTRSGYYAKLHVSEVNCSYQGVQSKSYSISSKVKPLEDQKHQDKRQEFIAIIEKVASMREEENLDESNEQHEKQMQGILKAPLSQMFKKTNSTTSLYFEPMLCPDYALIGNGICDHANDNLVCYFDGGDCSLGGNTTNCTSLECVDNLKFDPCPKFEKIGNHQCDKENFNIICSFDAGDCQTG